jgi:hypothetical protein
MHNGYKRGILVVVEIDDGTDDICRSGRARGVGGTGYGLGKANFLPDRSAGIAIE